MSLRISSVIYLLEQPRIWNSHSDNIHFVLSHPNGWEGTKPDAKCGCQSRFDTPIEIITGDAGTGYLCFQRHN